MKMGEMLLRNTFTVSSPECSEFMSHRTGPMSAHRSSSPKRAARTRPRSRCITLLRYSSTWCVTPSEPYRNILYESIGDSLHLCSSALIQSNRLVGKREERSRKNVRTSWSLPHTPYSKAHLCYYYAIRLGFVSSSPGQTLSF